MSAVGAQPGARANGAGGRSSQLAARSHVGSVCVIGAGSAGLTALRELRQRGQEAVCYEQGSHVAGNWRYENDNGVSAAYESLRCNVSRRRMEYRAFRMPASYGQFVSHADMAAYLDAYTAAFGLREHIRFGCRVERIEPERRGWLVRLADGSEREHRAVIVANGHDWQPAWPRLAGRERANISITHAHDYRSPVAHMGKRTLVIGTGQSACEIATELAREVGHATISARSGAHVIPRRMFGLAFDELDLPSLNRLPWWLINSAFTVGVRVTRTRTEGLPRPAWGVLEQVPIVSSDLCEAVANRRITVASTVERIEGSRVYFADGTSACFDHVLCATGYRLSFPFADASLLAHGDKQIELYRRIVPPDARGLFLIGFVDAPSGNLKIFEHQAAWIADVLEGRIQLPAPATMRAAAARSEGRTRERFPREAPHSIRTDAHAYVRNLRRDRRRSWVGGVWARGGGTLGVLGAWRGSTASRASEALRASEASWVQPRPGGPIASPRALGLPEAREIGSPAVPVGIRLTRR